MDHRAPAHSDTGVIGLLGRSWPYRLFSMAVGGTTSVRRLVQDYIRPFDGCRILDIGCGPGNLPAHLPPSIGFYHGIDVNPVYVETARRRWKQRPECTFQTQEVRTATALEPGHYDIVVAIAIVHHLDDQDADRLFGLAHESLKPGGRLITYDGVYVDRQNRVARWLIAQDRGTRVRTPAGYRALAGRRFHAVEGTVLHDTLRVPYTIYAMTCTKR